MYVYIYLCVNIHTYMYIYIHIYTYTYTYTDVFPAKYGIFTPMPVKNYPLHIYTYIYICIYIQKTHFAADLRGIYVRTYVYIYIHMCIRVYIYIYSQCKICDFRTRARQKTHLSRATVGSLSTSRCHGGGGGGHFAQESAADKKWRECISALHPSNCASLPLPWYTLTSGLLCIFLSLSS